ncbi:hypothetical protein BX600DRAFT_454167 [Xylariales sp. PMI_506]|nr:hypothetical protein BX600DRAFT_454167 [Xylariales sp. PMI_506]
MAEENRRVSTTPIPVPVPFGAPLPPAPTPSPLSQTPVATAPPTEGTPPASANAIETPADVTMADSEQAASPAPAPAAAASPAPVGGRTSTPSRTNGPGEPTSRAASQHPDPGFIMPAEAPAHGAPVRQYLNSKVTGALLEGMKLVAKEQPKDPLRVLGEYLLQRSKEVEGST